MAIARFAAVLTGRRRLRPMTPSTGNPASVVLTSRSRLYKSTPSFAGKFLQKAARAPVLFHP